MQQLIYFEHLICDLDQKYFCVVQDLHTQIQFLCKTEEFQFDLILNFQLIFPKKLIFKK